MQSDAIHKCYSHFFKWEIVLTNCAEILLEPTNFFNFHQVTIEIRFGRSLAQERFKSNLEFRNQIIVMSIKFRKGFAKFMIPTALFKKFWRYQFIESVEVSNTVRCSSRTNELRDIDSIGCTSPYKNGKLTISKSKSSRLS